MKLNRRDFVKSMGLGSAAIGMGSLTAMSSCAPASSSSSKESDEPILQIGENIALTNTDRGKVKGFILNGIYTYLGIPYAADPSGKNRFLPPQDMQPWEGVRPAVFYGNSSPQTIYDRSTTSYSAFVDHWNFDEVSENCLTINVWTPAPDNKKRPVLVWLHGGGWRAGNGIEQDGYHGENLARRGDIVYCSINHRLGAFGFSDFSSVAGEKYKDSGLVSVLDMIAALKWVNRNIANFGGDPGNVTIMGQSGGGSKVCTLATMPEVKGLVHKGVALSGSSISGGNKENAQKLGEYIVKEAGLKPSQFEKLLDIPWDEYLKIADRASRRLTEETGLRASFGPVADGVHIPKDQYFSGNLPGEPVIPMIFCSTFHEQNPNRDKPELENLTLEGVAEQLASRYSEPGKAKKVVDEFAKAFPECRPIELYAMILSGRAGVVRSATKKLEQGAPVYVAWFGWCAPLFDGRLRAFHCSDISFWMYNTDRMYTHTGGGARPRALSAKMADSLVSFMRTGDPNCGALPAWPQFTAENGEVMVLVDKPEVKNDPDKDARAAMA